MKTEGWIKLHTAITEWEWYKDINVKVLFLHCLLRANWKEQRFMGRIIPAGSFVTSLQNISYECGLTIRQTRTVLNKLKMTNELTHQTTNHYSIISINNWDKYQINDKQKGKPMTNKCQTDDKPMTTIEDIKNIRSKDIKTYTCEENKKFDPNSVEVNNFVKDFQIHKNAKYRPSFKDRCEISRILSQECCYQQDYWIEVFQRAAQGFEINEGYGQVKNVKCTLAKILEKHSEIFAGEANLKPLLKKTNSSQPVESSLPEEQSETEQFKNKDEVVAAIAKLKSISISRAFKMIAFSHYVERYEITHKDIEEFRQVNNL